jgi:hypothetical protein
MPSGLPSPIALVVAALSSAAAAVVVHSVWAPGTIAGAAMMPVLVMLFSELLRHPAERLSRAARERQDAHLSIGSARSPYRVYRMRPRWWRVLATGMAAFVLGGAALTAAELVLERSLADRGERTTLLGGAHVRRSTPSAAAAQAPGSTLRQPAATACTERSTAKHPEITSRHHPGEDAKRTREPGKAPGRTTPMVTPTPTPDSAPTSPIASPSPTPPADASSGTPPPTP